MKSAFGTNTRWFPSNRLPFCDLDPRSEYWMPWDVVRQELPLPNRFSTMIAGDQLYQKFRREITPTILFSRLSVSGRIESLINEQ